MEEKQIGIIAHYYDHLGVGIVELTEALKVGDAIHIKGHSSDFMEMVASMQVEHASVQEAKKGDIIGLKLSQKVHVHDKVYKA
ncbi:MAG: hypothetical protein V1893_03290 [Candidatus Omnitrophota bacterium]